MMDTINKLRAIAASCRDGRPLAPDLAFWLGASLSAFLEHRFSSVDEALGLRFAPGGVPWWLEEGMRIRDAALRDLARRYAAGKPLAAQAAYISQLSRRFGTTGWPADLLNDEMPIRYIGTPKELLWVAFKSGARMPIGERRLRSILVGCSAPRIPNNDNTPGSSSCASAVAVDYAGGPHAHAVASARAAVPKEAD